jgi:acetyltransferase-like isoleucine patch superfamily enzyme/O-antigen/teichoic acid export membrane protein
MSIKRRIIHGLGANGFGQAVTLLTQIASVPIMINAWGVELYGEWVALSALPAYLVLSNLGLTSTAGNSLAMIAEKGDQRDMQGVFQSTWAMVNIVSFGILFLLTVIILNINLKSFFGLTLTSNFDFNFTLIILLFNVAMSMQTGIFEIAFRAIKKNPVATFFSNMIRLFEWLVATVLVLLGEKFMAIATGASLVRLLGNLIFWLILVKSGNKLKIGTRYASLAQIRKLLRPAIATMCFPIGLSLSMQGIILIISSLVGSAGVTLFSVYRTFTRVPIQLATSINQAVWPELSYAYGNNDIPTVKNLVNKMQLICAALGIIVVAVIYFFGVPLINIWTSTPLQHNELLLQLLTATAFIHIFWQPLWVVQMATNKHILFAVLFLVISVFSFVLGWFLTQQSGLQGCGYAILASEFLMFISAFFTYHKQFRAQGKNSYFKYLVTHRIKPKVFTYQWYKSWAKRIVNFKALCHILISNSRLSNNGATIGFLSVISDAELNGKLENLIIGSECYIGNKVHLALHAKIILGNNVVINDGCTLLTGSHDVNCPNWKQLISPIIIEDYAWIATNSIILPGVTIGKGAVVGAGSVVTKSIPAYQIFAGNPAKFIKDRELKQFSHVPVRRLAPFEAWLGLPEIENNTIKIQEKANNGHN